MSQAHSLNGKHHLESCRAPHCERCAGALGNRFLRLLLLRKRQLYCSLNDVM